MLVRHGFLPFSRFFFLPERTVLFLPLILTVTPVFPSFLSVRPSGLVTRCNSHRNNTTCSRWSVALDSCGGQLCHQLPGPLCFVGPIVSIVLHSVDADTTTEASLVVPHTRSSHRIISTVQRGAVLSKPSVTDWCPHECTTHDDCTGTAIPKSHADNTDVVVYIVNNNNNNNICSNRRRRISDKVVAVSGKVGQHRSVAVLHHLFGRQSVRILVQYRTKLGQVRPSPVFM